MPSKEIKSIMQTTLAEYGKDIKDLTNIKPKDFDIRRVASMIESIPERKWRAAQAVVDGTIAKKTADKNVKAIRATKMLYASVNKDRENLSSAGDRTAFVDDNEEVQAAEIAAIEAEAELIAAKLAYECLDDLFTAGKKVMDWLTEQDKAQRMYDRFVNEGNRSK